MLEPQAEEAGRSWAGDLQLFAGYDAADPRPPLVRAVEATQAVVAERGYERIGLELSLGTQASDIMVGEPTTYTHDFFHAFGDEHRRRDAAPRGGAGDQDHAGDRADPPRERARGRGDGARARADPAGDDGERGGGALRGLRPRRRHRLPRPGRARARLHARLVGPRDQDVHRHGLATGRRGPADAVRDLGLLRRLLGRPHEEPLRRAGSSRATPSCSRRCRRSTTAPSPTCGTGPSWPSSTGTIREGIAAAGYPGQPSHPICHGVGARAHEPPYAHQAGGGVMREGMVLAIEPGIYWPGGGGLRLEDNFLVTADGCREAVAVPGRRRHGVSRFRSRGKSVVSRMFCAPVSRATQRSSPIAKPPSGGMPYRNACR